jgi:hypothetical protein
MEEGRREEKGVHLQKTKGFSVHDDFVWRGCVCGILVAAEGRYGRATSYEERDASATA